MIDLMTFLAIWVGGPLLALWFLGTFILPGSKLGRAARLVNAKLFAVLRRQEKENVADLLHQEADKRKKKVHADADTIADISADVKQAERQLEQLDSDIAELKAGYERDLRQLKEAQEAGNEEKAAKEKRQAASKLGRLKKREGRRPNLAETVERLKASLKRAKADLADRGQQAVDAADQAELTEAELNLAELTAKTAQRQSSLSDDGDDDFDRLQEVAQREIDAKTAKAGLYDNELNLDDDDDDDDDDEGSALLDEQLEADLKKLG